VEPKTACTHLAITITQQSSIERKRKLNLITPASVMERLSVEALCETADGYYRSLVDPTEQMGKPFSNPLDTPDMLINLGQLLSGLQLTKSMTVLDFAAGTCWLSRYLNQMQCATISLDASKAALAIGERLFNAHPIVGQFITAPIFLHFNGRYINLPDASVDRIVCFDAFHHIPNQREILLEMARILKPGGIAGFSEPGRTHSQTAMSQKEMAEYDVLENDLILDDVVALAYEVGFTEFMCKLGCGNELTLEEYVALVNRKPSEGLQRRINDNIYSTMINKSVFFLQKGDSQLDSRGITGLDCSIKVDARQMRVSAGDKFLIRCLVRNTGHARWLHNSLQTVGTVRIGTHLYDANDKLLNLDFGRSPLEKDIEPNEETICDLHLRIAEPGQYRIMVDMVSEHVCWFENLGFKPVAVDVIVSDQA
jgi:ubiquinone/menaquinone biosynthesis C-methylase UbiE